MTGPHACVADAAVVEDFDSRSKREREELLRIFRSLAAEPYQRGDWLQKTASGQQVQVKRFGRWMVSYWCDGPVREVRIVDVERLPL